MLVQFLGSLAAILALVALAHRLRLGPSRRLADKADAREAAVEAVDGFDPIDIALDAQGRGALLRDEAGQIMVLRQHGVHFAGRILSTRATAHAQARNIVIETGERRYGAVTLDIDQPQAWVQLICARETKA